VDATEHLIELAILPEGDFSRGFERPESPPRIEPASSDCVVLSPGGCKDMIPGTAGQKKKQ
jgi:hypothetical protein